MHGTAEVVSVETVCVCVCVCVSTLCCSSRLSISCCDVASASFIPAPIHSFSQIVSTSCSRSSSFSLLPRISIVLLLACRRRNGKGCEIESITRSGGDIQLVDPWCPNGFTHEEGTLNCWSCEPGYVYRYILTTRQHCHVRLCVCVSSVLTLSCSRCSVWLV